MTTTDHYSKRTLLDFTENIRRLNKVGASSGNGRTDSEWFHRHPLAKIPPEHREALEKYLDRITPSRAVTATADITAPDGNGIHGSMLAAWLARFPSDAVVTRESEDPLTLRATWTETR